MTKLKEVRVVTIDKKGARNQRGHEIILKRKAPNAIYASRLSTGAGDRGRTGTVSLPLDFENCRQLCKSLQSFAVYSRLFPIFGALQALKIQTYENTGNAKNEKEVDLVEVW